MARMVIKKGKKGKTGKTKGKQKAETPAVKRSSVARPKKKAATRLAKKATARKTPPRKSAVPKPLARRAAPRAPTPRKPPAKKATGARATSNAIAPKTINRQDRPGHLDPRYVAKLREQSGQPEYSPRAFIETPRSPKDDLAEELGEEVVARATSGEDDGEEALDQIVPEEQGGPFVETNAAQEFAHGTDASNPKGAKREPFPRT
jgi:hypothetical protein